MSPQRTTCFFLGNLAVNRVSKNVCASPSALSFTKPQKKGIKNGRET